MEMAMASSIPSTRSTSQTPTARDEAGELSRRSVVFSNNPPSPIPERAVEEDLDDDAPNPYEPLDNNTTPQPRRYSFTRRLLGINRNSSSGEQESLLRNRSNGMKTKNRRAETTPSSTVPSNDSADRKTKTGLGPRPVGGHDKLGTFSGVFVPTCLNVLSILMFLRFGFILGQAGVIGILGMLIVAYLIDLITTFSLSAIATNGTVRGGGAYYLISRSLGPEFGGAIGLVFYLGLVFNTGLNAVALIDCIKQNFGVLSGNWYQVLPESAGWDYLWATIVLLICTGICLAGSAIFARASTGLLVILLVSTFSIPFSALLVAPFESRRLGIQYTGLSWVTFKGNLMPRLTKGAAGSRLPGKETFEDLFGILFPATSGIFAGASMSGDLKHPSKAIPKGTLWALGLTFCAYTLVILAMAATTTRASFIADLNVIQNINVSGTLVLAGEFATTFFSTLMGVIGAAKLLQALARDELFPGLKIFGQGTQKGDEPTYAIFMSYVVSQIIMLGDINQIASFVTMTYLMTFLVMNLATFLLKISSAPNFRPSFHFFSWQTAFVGAIMAGTAMYFVDGLYASACVAILIVLFLLVHYTSRPRSWGDVSQSLIYHQVRKYLLRLKQEHVKFWRPQILLFVNDPRRQYELIQFCNSMKKGALYILGHVIVSPEFGTAVPEARRQQAAWSKYIDFSRVKAFVNISISPSFEWGARNIALSAGLGGMRPNIAILGFYNMADLTKSKPLIDILEEEVPKADKSSQNEDGPSHAHAHLDGNGNGNGLKLEGHLPTDYCKTESTTSLTGYVTLLEDLLFRLQINVAVARGFNCLEFPNPGKNIKKYIDLWPIQMSAEIATKGDLKAHLLTTNFDTYTLILQLGCILNTVPAWKKSYKLRVAVFVEYESDVEEERRRVQALLVNLRIQAEVLVFWLASGDLATYEIIVNGRSPDEKAEKEVDECLANQDWWEGIQKARGKRGEPSPNEEIAGLGNVWNSTTAWPEASFQQGPRHEKAERFIGLRKLLQKTKRRHTISGLSKLGVNLGMRAQRLPAQLAKGNGDQSDESDSEEGFDSDSEAIESDDETESLGTVAATRVDEHDLGTGDGTSSPTRISRRRSHGDSLRNSLSSSRSTGERDSTVTEAESLLKSALSASHKDYGATSKLSNSPRSKTSSSPDITRGSHSRSDSEEAPIRKLTPSKTEPSSLRLEDRFSALRKSPSPPTKQRPFTPSERPSLSTHASQPKFTSKPVPVTRVATEDGIGPSIMFTDTPSPPLRTRLRSAYDTSSSSHQNTNEAEQNTPASSPSPSPNCSRGSSYATQAVPLSFNDLPCRAQHLILNELMRKQSEDTAVMFTTLPSPVEGTSRDEDACVAYLSDLEVLGRGCPPCLMVHSNSMTVTMSL